MDPSTLPQPPASVPASELAETFACGPWKTGDLRSERHTLLNDRVSFRFVEGGAKEGSELQGKLEAKRDGVTMFFGAREMYQLADEQFERHATKTGQFGGDYTVLKVEGPDAKAKIVAGFVEKLPNDRDQVAVAHGWFPDAQQNVVDVAVFVSKSALSDTNAIKGCHGFAKQLFASVEPGARVLSYGSSGKTTREVSFAKFEFDLGTEWVVTTSMGIHDFARISFQKRGVFPVSGAALEMGLDSHPGDWASPGAESAKRQGTLLGLSATWRITEEHGKIFGAWTISAQKSNRDHAVASMFAGSAGERDEGIRFAESVSVSK